MLFEREKNCPLRLTVRGFVEKVQKNVNVRKLERLKSSPIVHRTKILKGRLQSKHKFVLKVAFLYADI